MTQSAALLLAALYTNALHTYYSACRQLPFCTTSAMLGPFKACCNVALLLETTIHIAEDHMHLQVSTSLIDHLFGFFTTTCCLSACCGCASPRACEEARLLLAGSKNLQILVLCGTYCLRCWTDGHMEVRTMRHVASVASEYSCLLLVSVDACPQCHSAGLFRENCAVRQV